MRPSPAPVRLLVTALFSAALPLMAAVAADIPLARPPVDAVGTPPSQLNLPQLGEPADSALSPAQEQSIGTSVMSQLYQYDYVLEDPEITEYLTNIGWRLVAAAEQKPPALDVFMVRDTRINAFALPGGHIGFNAGLLMAAQTESELAGVMGHELTHVTQRHLARSQDDAGGIGTIATWAAVLGAIIAGSANPDVILAALAIGQGTLYQKQVNFTRANEQEADRIGIQVMSRAGFDPQGMASFFQRLEQSSRLYGAGVPEFLRTHPVNTSRIAEAKERAAQMKPLTAPVQDPVDFQIMKARTLVLTSTRPSEAIEAFSTQLKDGKATPADRYGLALALSQTGDNGRAISVLKPAYDADPRQVNLALLMATLKLAAGQGNEAVALFEKTYTSYPRYSPAILQYAAALIQVNKPEEARKILLASDQAYGTRMETYRLLSQAARDSGNNAEASYDMASYLYFRGDYGNALAQLDAGLRYADISPQDRARLAARRAEVREALPRNYNPYNRQRR